MKEQRKIPVVAAQAVISGRSYSACLKEYEAMTPQEQAEVDDEYVSNNMGYGIEAWKAYTEARDNGR